MTPDELRDHLQTAIEIEWSTIPPYLCALWSIPEGRNELAATCVRDVVMEEMLHVTLACNLLNAIGGSPRFTPRPGKPVPAPDYPSFLPHSNDAFVVDLRAFSREALETFRKIEQPAAIGAPPESDDYQTIAQFYEAVAAALAALSPGIFVAGPTPQVDGAFYYGGGGEAFPIHDLPTASEALDVIIFQGEGIDLSIWDPDHDVFGEQEELAHYFRFDELYQERRYVQGDTPSSGPSGDPILIDYAAIYPMRPNPKAESYPPGSELRALTEECNATYSKLLTELEAGFTGTPSALVGGVQTMIELRYQAIALMQVPLDDGTGQTAGPAFQWRARSDRQAGVE
ncbi:MAG TPA: ferritin-like protein [Gaiellaceae bacterium]|jgi:hypothetical protein